MSERRHRQADAQLVSQARADLGTDASDAAIVERALNAYLLGRLLSRAQDQSSLSEDEADRLAYAELHASRRERRDVA